MICDNLNINSNGHLTFAGRDTVELAEKYGTPAYIMDEAKIREKCRIYKSAMAEYSARVRSLSLPANHCASSRYTG